MSDIVETVLPPEVALKPESCKTCPLYMSREGIVWGHGPTDAKIMFVGEAPGEDEGRAKIPFIGGSGRVFSALCQHAGVERSKAFVTNVVKCRPTAKTADGRTINRQPTENEIRHCARLLIHEIRTVNPNVLVPLGNVPLQTLTGAKKGITLMRSVPIEGPKREPTELDPTPPKIKVVGTFHPAFVMRAADMWPAAVFDLHRAKTESTFREIIRRPWKRTLHAKLSDVGDGLMRRIRDLGVYHHDLETTGLDGKVDATRCTGIAAHWDDVYCFDNTADVIEFIDKLHKDPTLTVCGQNSEGFDIPFQENKGYVFPWDAGKKSYDTMIGHHLLNSALPKDLGFIGATVTDEPYWKDDTMYKSGEDALQAGCCKDVHATARAYEDQHTELNQYGQTGLYYNQIMPLQPVLRAMTKRGVRKDKDRAAGWHVLLMRHAAELEVKLRKGLGDATFDVHSPKQLMDLLYTRMGLPVQYNKDKEKGFRPTVDADALDALSLITKNPIFTLVRTIRTLHKWDSTYIQCPQDADWFIHGRIGSAKAATGRLNHTDPNMANWPSEIREIVVPDNEDCVLLSRDWSQIEWQLAMVLSGDKAGLDALAAGRDAHRDAYALAFQKLYDEVTTPERYEAKFINYGLLYGRGEESISAGRTGHPETAIPLDRVVTYIHKFFTKFSGYAAYREHIKNQVLQHHFLETAWGRRRWWYTRQLPEIYNFPMQGNAAHLMYIALIELERELRNVSKYATLRLSVHDEVVINTPKDQKTLAAVQECTRAVMEQIFPEITQASMYPDVVRHYYPGGWKCESDCHIGVNWRACKPETDVEKQNEKDLRLLLGVPTDVAA